MRWLSRVRSVAVGVGVVAAACITSVALGAPGDPETMGPITLPVTITSIVTAVITAGGAILVAWFGVKIGFTLVRKLAGRLTRST